MTNELTIDEILGLLDWQRMMGADAALSAEPINWLEHGPTAPGYTYEWPRRDIEANAAAGPGSGQPQQSLSPTPTARAPALSAGAMPPQTTTAQTAAPQNRPHAYQPATRVPSTLESRPATPLAPSAAETDARRAASQATTLDALEKVLQDFDGCGLKATATNLCFYRGSAQARLMIIGEAPGRDEDLAGKPFVGRAGQLLDKMLSAIGLDESKVHITNIVYWRPPGNRTPTPQEAITCRPFLERQMELVAPDFIAVLGGAAAKEIFATTDGIMRLRGKWRQIKVGERYIPALATLHPAYLLRTPAAKQLVWADLLSIKTKLSERS